MNKFCPLSVAGTALMVMLTLSSCSLSRKAGGNNRTDALTGEAILREVMANQMQADWLDGKVNIDYNDGDQSFSATASIKMRKDSVIWMNVKKFGFELGRVLVTKDSIYILDRINNEFSVEPLSYVEERYNFPASLNMLELLILGNPFFIVTDSLQAQPANEQHLLSATRGLKSNRFWFDAKTYRLQKMQIEEDDEKRRMNLELLNYTPVPKAQDFSYLRKIEVASSETGRANIQIEFTKVEINVPTDIKFEIPERYSRSR